MVYIAKGTPPGYDVDTAVDYLNSFNSGWPLLKIHETGVSTGSVNHNLGYPPFHFITYPDGSFIPGAVNQSAHDEWSVSPTQLVRQYGTDGTRYFIARLDLTQNFTAQQIAGTSTQVSPSSDYVFKLAKPGKDVNSVDMRDFSLHSDSRSPMVHMVNHGLMSSGGGLGLTRTVAHGLGYIPTVFVFMKPGANSYGLDPNRYGIVMPPVGASGRYFQVDQNNVYVSVDSFDFTGSPSISVVVLKDPFNKPNVNVSYP